MSDFSTRTEARSELYSAGWAAFEIRSRHGEQSPEYAEAKARTDRAREAYAAICDALYAPGDRLINRRFAGTPQGQYETFVVTKVERDMVFTRNEYSGSEGVMLASFYEQGFDKLAPVVSP